MLFLINDVKNDKNRKKLECLYKLYIKDILYVSNDILKDRYEAEDVAQSTMIKLAENIDKIKDVESKKTRAFAVIIAKNLSRNIYRKRQQKKMVPIEETITHFIESNCETPEEYILRLDNSKWIAQQLSNVKEEYAEILTLRYTYDYKIDEISKLLDISEGNVRTRLLRAKKALRKVVEGEYDETIREKTN